MNVLCTCGSYHETTEDFDPSKRPHGAMFRLKEPYRSNGWASFPEHEGVTGDALECPNCGSPYGYPVRVDDCVKDTPPPEADDDLILTMHREGFRPKDIAQQLGLSSHMKVVARLRAMGEK